MSKHAASSHKTTDRPADGGLEKAVRDYQDAGGANAGTDEAKTLEGQIAKVSAGNDEGLKKARPESSRTSNR